MEAKAMLKTALKILVLGAIIFFLAQRLIKSYAQISEYGFSIRYSMLSIAIILGFAGMLVLALSWRLCLKASGGNIGLSKTISIWFKSQMPKYIPGTVWYMLCRVYDCGKLGIPKKSAVISLFLEAILMGASSLILAFAFLAGKAREYIPLPVFLFCILAGFIALHPKIINKIASLLKKDFRVIHVAYGQILFILLSYMAAWILVGAGFFFLAVSIFPVSISSMVYLAGSFLLAWTAGFVSIFSPGGIGVREGIITLLLSAIMPSYVAIIIAFASRIWWTLIEVLIFVIWRKKLSS
ncbi:MAG: lysylphosphatidylglycerol synthase domain-containing protein [Nanoarchaeota archaeon]|nr:lysylphosphatidylglycerol synthase domain-containing protein [Nanoarchaeota archaeon]